MTERILVTGAKGQLGYDMVKLLEESGYICRGIDISDLDLTQKDRVLEYVAAYKPSTIIHCAAYTAVDKAETDKDLCRKVNVDGTINLAQAALAVNAAMVYISTDYVYSGEGDKPFEPEDRPQPQNYYGITKLEGENAVKSILTKYFIVRTSWVFGKNGNNFVKTMLRLGKEKPALNVVCDQTGSPTYTVDLCKLLFEMIKTKRYGTYNASNEGFCNWYEFAVEIFKQANITVTVNGILTKDYPTAAKRPFNSRMSKDKLSQNGFTKLPDWKNALERYLKELS